MTKSPTLRDLSRRTPSKGDAEAMLDEISKGSDRSAAILSINVADAILKQYITVNLPRSKEESAISLLFEDNGALPTLSGRIDMAYAMGIIEKKMCDDLHILRRVRNAFAHAAVPIQFTQPEIAKEIRKISDWKVALGAKSELIKHHQMPDGSVPSDERIVYTAHCNVICVRLLLRILQIKEKELEKIKEEIDHVRSRIGSKGETL